MDNCAIEDLLSSFASDSFAVQSQPERDLRASLVGFLDPHRSGTLNPYLCPEHPSSFCLCSASRVSSTETELQSFQESRLLLNNTPIGSPIKENFLIASAPADYLSPSKRPSINIDEPNSAHTMMTNVALGNCLGCLQAVPIPSSHTPFPHNEGCLHYAQSINTSTILNPISAQVTSAHFLRE
ncbi:hypothetical protein O181_005107 [Austropuccinia psidii MF-1]|uniref:Uncharacterized protein n=1 Tax=Austropuccinia psidii MF-1 TaxID=1389203 RepID=A0A9Q3BI49_9BASI|nr:hypothetical protein [Austropuccinia psidii MF-1]